MNFVTHEEFQCAVAALNDGYGVASLGGSTVVISNNGLDFNGKPCDQFMKIEEFKSYWCHENWLVKYPDTDGTPKVKSKNLIKEWLRWPGRKTYKGIVFCPEGNVPEDCYNLWQGFAIEPIAGDCSLFWHHLEDVVCNGDTEAFAYLKSYMAHAVQKIGELPEVALVFRGQQGIGKDAFITVFKEIFGKHFLVLSNMEDVTSKFNGPMMDKIIIQANEATWGGDKRNEGVLKTLITDRTRKYEFKGKDIIQANNYSRLLIVSNNDWIVPLDKDDRRYAFYNVSSKHKQDAVYFAALYDQLRNGGYSAVLHELLQYDISQFQPRSRPMSLVDAGIDQVYMRMSPIEVFVEDSLQTGLLASCGNTMRDMLSPREINFQELYGDYVAYCETNKVSRIPSTKEFSHKVFGYKGKAGLIPSTGKHQVLDSSYNRKMLCYAIPSLKECREYFSKQVLGGRTIEWDDDVTYVESLEYDEVTEQQRNVRPIRPTQKMLVQEKAARAQDEHLEEKAARMASTQRMLQEAKLDRDEIKREKLRERVFDND